MGTEDIRKIEIEGEKVFVKKDFLGWRVVHPIKNEDGTINWPNLIFGGKRNGFVLLIYLILAAMLFMGVWEMMASCRNMVAHPELYFNIVGYANPNFNLSSITIVP